MQVDLAMKIVRIIVLGALLLALGGCTLIRPAPDPGLAMRQSDGLLEFAVCTDIEVAHAWGELLEAGDDEWSTFWRFDGKNLSLRDGDVISLANITELDPDAFQPVIQPNDTVDVILSSSDNSNLIHATFYLTDSGMPDDEWLRTDGSAGAEPCIG
jgi:hypothetical protein